MKKIALVTGASSGIGKETVNLLLKEGFTVYGAARRLDKLEELKSSGAKIISLDVTDENSMKNAVETIIKAEGKIDILVNNAGYGSYGALEEVPIEEAKRQFEVNVFGLIRLSQLVLPSMKKNGYGKIINISSMGGKFTLALGGWYHATKHAVEALSDALRFEVKPFGVDVIIIEPGAIKSEWSGISLDNLARTSSKGSYSVIANKMITLFTNTYKNAASPKVIAKTILKSIKKRRPKTRYAVPMDSKMYIFMRWLLSDKIFDKLLSIMIK